MWPDASVTRTRSSPSRDPAVRGRGRDHDVVAGADRRAPRRRSRRRRTPLSTYTHSSPIALRYNGDGSVGDRVRDAHVGVGQQVLPAEHRRPAPAPAPSSLCVLRWRGLSGWLGRRGEGRPVEHLAGHDRRRDAPVVEQRRVRGEPLDAHQLLGVEAAVRLAELGVALARDLTDLAVVRHRWLPWTSLSGCSRPPCHGPRLARVGACAARPTRCCAGSSTTPRCSRPATPRWTVGLAEHAAHRSAGYAGSRRAVPLPGLAGRRAAAPRLPADAALRLAIVFDVDRRRRARGPAGVSRPTSGLTLAGVEASLATLGDDATAVGANLARLPGATGYLEVPRHRASRRRSTSSARLGLARRQVPHRRRRPQTPSRPRPSSPRSWWRARARDLPFKLTAGLHHAVRSTDAADGLRAARRAQRPGRHPGRPARRRLGRAVAAVLAERRPGPRCWRSSRRGTTRTCADVRTVVPLLRLLRRDRPARRAGRARPPGGRAMSTWFDVPAGSPFPATNLPYGVFSARRRDAAGRGRARRPRARPRAARGGRGARRRARLRVAVARTRSWRWAGRRGAAVRSWLVELLEHEGYRELVESHLVPARRGRRCTCRSRSPTTSTSTPRSTTPRTSGASSGRTATP